MKLRAIDEAGDWLFGKGQNDFLKGNASVIQDIATRLNSFLGDCFFDLGAGLDWFNLLGAKNQLALNLAVTAVILNTQNVTRLIQLSILLDKTRNVTIKYQVQTTYSVASGLFGFTPNLTSNVAVGLDGTGGLLFQENGSLLYL